MQDGVAVLKKTLDLYLNGWFNFWIVDKISI